MPSGSCLQPTRAMRRSGTRVNQRLHTVEQELKPEHERLSGSPESGSASKTPVMRSSVQGWEGILVDQPVQGGAVRQRRGWDGLGQTDI